MYALTIILLLLAALFYASYSMRPGVYVKAYCRKKTGLGVVSLTFDDGPHPVRTAKVLDVLKRHGAKAAFFVVGEKAEACPEIVKRIVDEGHIIGNHTYSHSPRFPLMRTRDMLEEMRRCDLAVARITGSRPELFRPPYGVTNPMVGKAVRLGNYKVAGWDVRSLDTVARRSRSRVFQRVRRHLRKGSVILLHDDRDGSDILLEMILEHLGQKGFRVERFDKLFGL